MAQSTTSKVSNDAVKAATGKTWEEWYALIEAAGGREMSHKDIAAWLNSSGNLTLPWWGQMVTVGYEQHIGRRESGQNCYGEFVANTSKAIAGDLNSVLNLWLARVNGLAEFNGVRLAGEPKVSATEKWRYWRVALADGSAISINIGIKSEGKIGRAVDHGKLADKETADTWKVYWKGFLAAV